VENEEIEEKGGGN